MTKHKVYDSDGEAIERIYQWDQNRHIVLSGLDVWDDATIYCDFSTISHRVMYSVPTEEIYSVDGTRYYAVIPNEILMQTETVILYVYQVTEQNENFTIATIRIPIVPRQKPMGYIYVPTDNLVKVADGLVNDNGTIYLTADGEKFGDGASAGGGGGGGVIVGTPEKIIYIPNRSPADVQIGRPEHIEEPALA